MGEAPPAISGHRTVRCRCSCGIEKSVRQNLLIGGGSRRCSRCATTPHGDARRGSMTVEFIAWLNMHARCKDTGKYVKRGIIICDEWAGPGGFAAFLVHIGRRPDSKLSLDRIDNDGDYEPGNVRWATRSTQSNNKSTTRFIAARGRRLSVAQWSLETGLHRNTITKRLDRGLSPEEALCPSDLRRSI